MERFLIELGWREFAHHVLDPLPETPDRPLRRQFERFPWSHDTSSLRAWQAVDERVLAVRAV